MHLKKEGNNLFGEKQLVKRKRSSGSSGFGDFGFGDGLRNYQKRATLSNNRMKGRMAEDSFQMEQNLQGNDCRKIHKGAISLCKSVISSAIK